MSLAGAPTPDRIRTGDPGSGPTVLPSDAGNAVSMMLSIVGDEWNLVILQRALRGIRRYAEFKAALPISNSVLTNRLSGLVELGLLRREPYQESPIRHEYRLTDRGRDMWPVMMAIWAWELQWVGSEHHEPLPQPRHRLCSNLFRPVLTCAACRRVVLPRDVSATFGPSGSWPRSVPAGTTRRRSGSGSRERPGMFPETMALIGNRWASALLGTAFRGAARFGEFTTALSIPPTVLAERLRTFCELGVLAPTADQGRADWVSYRLTDKGRAFFPVVATALHWGQEWYHCPEGVAVIETHRACGAVFRPQLACDACREPLDLHEIEVVGR